MLVLAAVTAALVVPACASAKSVPGVVADITFKGQAVGKETVSFAGKDADPDLGCPALPPSGYTSEATTHWNATYHRVLLSLDRATGALSSRRVPTSSGGLTGGSLSMSGTTPEQVFNTSCWAAQSFTFSSALARAPGRAGKPLFERNVGSDVFFLAGGLTNGITGSPASFTLPGSREGGDRIPDLLPLYLAPGAEVLPKQASKKALASFAGGAVEWNRLLGPLRSLRHRRTIRFTAHGSYEKTFGNIGDAADSNGLIVDCAGAADEYRGGSTACTESTRGDFTITVRRVKLVTIVVE